MRKAILCDLSEDRYICSSAGKGTGFERCAYCMKNVALAFLNCLSPCLIPLSCSSTALHLPSLWTAVSSSGAWAVGRSHWCVQWGGMFEVVRSSWIPQRLLQQFPEHWSPIKSCFLTPQGGSTVKNARYGKAVVDGCCRCFRIWLDPTSAKTSEHYTTYAKHWCYRFCQWCCCLATCLFCPRQHGWAKRNAAQWPP